MAQIIPIYLTTSSDFSQELELGGQLVNMRIKWNVRNDTAHMDFKDPIGNWIYGVKVVPYWPLFRQIKGAIEFDGDLMVLADDQGVGTQITYDNFGNGQNLYYLSKEEADYWEEINGSL